MLGFYNVSVRVVGARHRWVGRGLLAVFATLVVAYWCPPVQAEETHKFLKELAGFSQILGLAISAGALYAADRRKGAIIRVSATTGAADTFSCATGECKDYIHGGDELTGTPAGAFQRFNGVAVNNTTGEIYVSAGTAIDVFAASGEYLGDIVEVPASSGAHVTGAFSEAAGVSFDQETSELYVAVESESPGQSDVVDAFKMKAGGDSEYSKQIGVGVLADGGGWHQQVAVAETGALAGYVYVGDRPTEGGQSGHVVDVFSPLSTHEATWTGAKTISESFGIHEVGVEVDRATGRVYVGDIGHDVVDEMPGSVVEGKELGRLKNVPEGSYTFTEPRAVAVDPSTGDLFVGNAGVVDVFGPDASLPEVEPLAATGIMPRSAVFNGKVSTVGEGESAACAFAWGETSALGHETGCAPSTIPAGVERSVTASVSGLRPDTTYFYRLHASNGNGTNVGEAEPIEMFTTPGPGVGDSSAADVSSTSVSLRASISPHNGPLSLSGGAHEGYYFQYSTSPLPACEPACRGDCEILGCIPAPPGESLGEGEAPEAVQQHVQGLAPRTGYYYRVVAVHEPSPGHVEEFSSNEGRFETQGEGGFTLPDGRGWEMVSQPAKEGALIQGPGVPWGVTQAAADGEALTYLTNVPTEKGVVGYADTMQLMAQRTPEGWVSSDLASPHNGAVSVSDEAGQEYRFFNETLTQAVLQPFGPFQPCETASHEAQPCLSPHASEQTAFEHTDFPEGNPQELCTQGCNTPMVTGCPGHGQPCPQAIEEDTDVPEGTTFGQTGHEEGLPCTPEKFCGPLFVGSSPNAEHVIVHSDTPLLSSNPGECGLYEWNQSQPPHQRLQYLSILPEGKGTECVSSLGTFYPVIYNGDDARHAVSDDGSRVFWTSNSKQLFMRDVPLAETIQIGGVAQFQTASSDGSRVFFSEGGRLLECDIPEQPECDPVQVGEAPPGEGSVIGASEDGSYIYYAAGDHNLYMDHYSAGEWHTTLIAELSTQDTTDWADNSSALSKLTARVSPHGQWLAFMSSEDLAGYNNHDASSGQPDEEAYLYNAATGQLTCASCDPTGAQPTGTPASEAGLNGESQGWGETTWLSADLPSWDAYEGPGGTAHALVQPRYLSDSGRLFFDSDDALVPKDINNTWDVYEYEPEGTPAGEHACTPTSASGSVVFKPARAYQAQGRPGQEGAGCVGLISSGESGQESLFMDASQTGGDVFFMTTGKLSPRDFDNAYDVYDAHECTTASPCTTEQHPSPPECSTAESCRTIQPQPPINGTPPTPTFNGNGNFPPTPLSPPPKPKAPTRAQKLTAALKACHKDKNHHKRTACETTAHKKYGTNTKPPTHKHTQ